MVDVTGKTSALLMGLALTFGVAIAKGDRSPSVEDLRASSGQFFRDHCIKCHGSEEAKGDMKLHALDDADTTDEALQKWERILDVLENGEMPPEDEPQPRADERRKLIRQIESVIHDRVARSSPGEEVPGTRRLTNLEYQNTLRDLLGFELKLIDDLPQDPVRPYRFNNTSELMRIGPEQIDRYLECARRAMASAIVDPGPPQVHQTRREWKPNGVDRGLGADEIGVWGNRRNTPAQGMALKSYPATGEYRIRIQASAILPKGCRELPLRLVMGYGGLEENQSTHQIETVGTVRLTNSPDDPRVFEFQGRMENHPARPGKTRNGKRLPDTISITPQNLYDDGTLNDANDFSRTRNISMPRAVVQWIEFEAPLTDHWPPEHHTRILFDSPLRESDPRAYVKAVLMRFMSRAYRRRATESEVDQFARIYDRILPAMKTQEAAMRETLAMVLVSPQFLYHTVASDRNGRQHELASRLSYFLWASMPDDELRQLASEGKLDDPHVLEQQARRLLRDERSHDFVRNFTTQWLSLGKMKTVPINRDLFPRFLYYVPRGERAGTEEPYRPTIRDYMQQETVGFVAELIRRNASVLNIVDSDFAYLNQPLAAHYGVDGVHGIHFRPVAVKPSDRLGGLLTHGSILIGNSTGSAPHPIYRAVWLREAILGDDVPEPPAEVPALSDSAGDSAEQALSIKDLLAKHRQVESCNDCHSRLDPWGIPFEQYNAIGKYQPRVPKEGTRVQAFHRATHQDLDGYNDYLDSINTVKIEAHARVPQGPEIDGMQELKDHLLNDRRDDIVENVVRRLLSYSIGRDLNVRDRFAVAELVRRAEASEYRFQEMIVSICLSDTFIGRSPANDTRQ